MTDLEREAPISVRGGGRLAVAVHGGTALLASAYPLSSVVGANLGLLPLDASTIFTTLMLGFCVSALLLWLLKPLMTNLPMRAVWLTALLLVASHYGTVALGLGIARGSLGFAASYSLAALVAVTLGLRPWRDRPLDPISLVIVISVLLSFNLIPGITRMMGFRTGQWQQLAERLVPPASPVPATARPHIFYIVLDGFGRADTLARHYDIGLDDLSEFLIAKGFYVPSQARSNYTQTFLSLASFMNLAYMDEVAALAGPEEPSRLPLAHLIQNNALLALANGAGYDTIAIGSDYMATRRLANADVCICDPGGIDEIEQATIALTPLAGLLPLDRWAHDAHRRVVLGAFAALERVRRSASPAFVFAHIVAPHPPFVFAADGSAKMPSVGFGFDDGSHFEGSRTEYVTGYRDQVAFISKQIMALVNSLLDGPGPPPVIVVHGDHGPGSRLDWNSAQGTDLDERTNIFAAYFFPGGAVPLYPRVTPVNGVRLLANQYLGTALPLLRDTSWFSTWDRPFDFIEVPESGPATRTR